MEAHTANYPHTPNPPPPPLFWEYQFVFFFRKLSLMQEDFEHIKHYLLKCIIDNKGFNK